MCVFSTYHDLMEYACLRNAKIRVLKRIIAVVCGWIASWLTLIACDADQASLSGCVQGSAPKHAGTFGCGYV